MTTFAKRAERLPKLGVGLSGEFEIAAKGIDVRWMKEHYPALVYFYEYGADLDRGLDDGVRRWAAAGLPTTYHFLDINLEERIDSSVASRPWRRQRTSVNSKPRPECSACRKILRQ